MIFPPALYIGIPLLAVLALLRFKKREFKGGVRAAYTQAVKNAPLFKKLLIRYKIFTYMTVAVYIICVISSLTLLSRPARTDIIKQEQSNRDVFLCMDISTSVNDLNKSLIPDLKKMVTGLSGDRFGITIFNTSAVLLIPLTDDYDYILDTLDKLGEAFASLDDSGFWGTGNNFFEAFNFIFGGTAVGSEERGSSLIGDGLASCAYNFSQLDEDRSRCIIFTTDNDLEGMPYATLPQAADICASYDIIVYGIAPKGMGGILSGADPEEFKAAVESTGGKLFIQSDSGTVNGIIDSIKALRANQTEAPPLTMRTDMPAVPFVFCAAFFALILASGFLPVAGKKVRH